MNIQWLMFYKCYYCTTSVLDLIPSCLLKYITQVILSLLHYQFLLLFWLFPHQHSNVLLSLPSWKYLLTPVRLLLTPLFWTALVMVTNDPHITKHNTHFQVIILHVPTCSQSHFPSSPALLCRTDKYVSQAPFWNDFMIDWPMGMIGQNHWLEGRRRGKARIFSFISLSFESHF